MSQYRQDPFINFDGLQRLQEELGRVFEGDWIKPSSRFDDGDYWRPVMDVVEADNEYHFLMDLPGVSLSDVAVSVRRGQIEVSGERSNNSTGELKSKERRSGKFQRHIQLPEEADEATLAASMHNGVLTLVVSKQAGESARNIPVKEVD